MFILLLYFFLLRIQQNDALSHYVSEGFEGFINTYAFSLLRIIEYFLFVVGNPMQQWMGYWIIQRNPILLYMFPWVLSTSFTVLQVLSNAFIKWNNRDAIHGSLASPECRSERFENSCKPKFSATELDVESKIGYLMIYPYLYSTPRSTGLEAFSLFNGHLHQLDDTWSVILR